MKAAYIGIDLFVSALYSLIANGAEIMEIYTCKTDNKTEFNTQVIAAAKKLNVPLHLQPLTLDDIARMKQNGCEAIICAGCYYKLPVCADIPMINIHPSYLPVGRGAWPMPVAILNGYSTGGVTIHKMTNRFDEGDIILREQIKLAADENLKTYTAKINNAAAQMIERLMKNFDTLYASAFPQGKGEYWACPTEKDWTVTPDMSYEEIDRILRAFYGYECLLKTKEHTYELIGGRISREKRTDNIYFEINGDGYITADTASEVE